MGKHCVPTPIFLYPDASYCSLVKHLVLKYKPHDLVLKSCEAATAVYNSWYGFLGTDLVFSLIHDFDRTLFAGTFRHALFAGKR